MIKLENIKVKGPVVCCDIIPEDSELLGYIEIDTTTNSLKYSLPKGYEWCTNHIEHAKDFLNDLVELKGESPEEKLIMWY